MAPTKYASFIIFVSSGLERAVLFETQREVQPNIDYFVYCASLDFVSVKTTHRHRHTVKKHI